MRPLIYAFLTVLGLSSCGDAFASAIFEGRSVIDGVDADPCYVRIDQNEDGDIVAVTVSGLATESTFFKSKAVATTIDIRDEFPSEGWTGFTNFSRVPSVSHFGFTRIALLRRWGTADNPWPGIAESRYVVERDNFTEVIASDRISVLTDLATFTRAKIHCRNLVLSP